MQRRDRAESGEGEEGGGGEEEATRGSYLFRPAYFCLGLLTIFPTYILLHLLLVVYYAALRSQRTE